MKLKAVYIPVNEASICTDAIVSNNGEKFYTYCIEKQLITFTQDEYNKFLSDLKEDILKNVRTKEEIAIFTEGQYMYPIVDKDSIINIFKKYENNNN